MHSGSRSPEPTQKMVGLPQEAEPRRLREEEKAAWAALLAHAVPHQVHALAGPQGESPPPAARAAQAMQSALASEATQSQSSDTGSVNPDGPSRLTLSVTSETLGRIDFVVDRRSGELSLWIAASDEARALISADQTGLARHLEGARLPIKNLNIVGHGELGTVLARGRVKRAPDSAADSPPVPGRPRKRRLDLIG